MEKEIPGIYHTCLSPTYPAAAIEIEIEKQFKCRRKSKKRGKFEGRRRGGMQRLIGHAAPPLPPPPPPPTPAAAALGRILFLHYVRNNKI